MEYKIDGHTIEFDSGSSSIDPWTPKYNHEIGLSTWATSDIVPYIRIDGEEIYRIRSSNKSLEMRTVDDRQTSALRSRVPAKQEVENPRFS